MKNIGGGGLIVNQTLSLRTAMSQLQFNLQPTRRRRVPLQSGEGFVEFVVGVEVGFEGGRIGRVDGGIRGVIDSRPVRGDQDWPQFHPSKKSEEAR